MNFDPLMYCEGSKINNNAFFDESKNSCFYISPAKEGNKLQPKIHPEKPHKEEL
ncbi:MAG: hypothetical protein WA393_08595 [Nitrososphaeraceae archaeon]